MRPVFRVLLFLRTVTADSNRKHYEDQGNTTQHNEKKKESIYSYIINFHTGKL